jgi:hypothetical protein
MLLELTNGSQGNGNVSIRGIPEKWKIMVVENEEMIKDLVHVYFEVVYPL